MVAFSFQKRFVAPILSGQKAQTIRRTLRRGTRPGCELQIYTGMRTKYCRLIGRATAVSVVPIWMHFDCDVVFFPGVPDSSTPETPDQFARDDGFKDWLELKKFWAKQHPDVVTFDGWLIAWGNFQPAPEAA